MKEKQTRVNVFVPEQLWKEIKMIAALEGTTSKALVIEALKIFRDHAKYPGLDEIIEGSRKKNAK